MAVSKRGESWQVRVRDPDGNWFPAASFATRAEAKAHEANLIRSKARGARAVNLDWREMTMTEYWARWSVEFRMRVKKGWRISQDQMWRDYVEPKLGRKLIREITRSDIAEVINFVRERGRGTMMQIHVWSLMHQMFDAAEEELDIIGSNPVKRSLKPDKPETVREFLVPQEARRFLKHCADDYLGPSMWLMTLSALRIGEAQALCWRNVDFTNNEIFVTRQWNRKEKQFGPPKNGKPIKVPMVPELAEYLRFKKPENALPDDLVLKPKRGGFVVHYDTIEDGLKRLCTSGKFPKLSPHELRHTCTELWISERGATIEDMRRLLNHSSELSTRPYIHRTDDRLKRIAERKPELKLVASQ